MKLGERLTAIAGLTGGYSIADIGTDHAYLPAYLILNGLAPRAIGIEVHAGPYQAAQEMVERASLKDRIELRFGNGLAPLEPGEVEAVAIAGMGGATIIDIVRARPEIMTGLRRLVLQPMTAAGSVRRWLTENGWILTEEKLVWEEGRLYEIIAAEPGRSEHFEDILYDIGPVLWQEKPPLLSVHLEQLIVQTERIIGEMLKSEQAIQSPKFQELQNKMRALEEKRRCL